MLTQYYMPRMFIIPTLKCNLRCKLCVTVSPYYESPYHPTIEQLCQYVDRYFEVVDKVGIFSLSGGEAFVRRDLHKFVDYIYKYKDNLDKIEIITNGSILPWDALIESAARFGNKLQLLIDDYGSDISVRAKTVENMFGSIPGASIIHRDYYSENMHCNGWVDFGILSNKEKKNRDQADTLYGKCAYVTKMKLCTVLVGGVIFPCAAAVSASQLGITQANDDDVIDLFDKSYTDDEIRERIAAWYTRRHAFSACAYCNGICEDSERFTPAEQLPPTSA